MGKGIPFCRCPPEHCIDLYKGTGKGRKPDACEKCRLRGWCDYEGDDVKPITVCDKDLLMFLEERDESTFDWL